MLDVGCRTGLLLERLRVAHPYQDVAGADPSAGMLIRHRAGWWRFAIVTSRAIPS